MSHNGQLVERIYWQMRVLSQHGIHVLESAADFKTFGKLGRCMVHGSSYFPRLLYSSLMQNDRQSGDP